MMLVCPPNSGHGIVGDISALSVVFVPLWAKAAWTDFQSCSIFFYLVMHLSSPQHTSRVKKSNPKASQQRTVSPTSTKTSYMGVSIDIFKIFHCKKYIAVYYFV